MSLEDILNEPTAQISSNNVITLYAVWKDAVAGVTDSNGTETNFDDFDTAWRAAAGKTIKLYSDVTITGVKVVGTGADTTQQGITIIYSNGDVTLDLNGKTITYDDNTGVQVESTFTLKDSTNSDGKIYVGASTGGAIYIKDGTFIMESGLITGMDCQDSDSSNIGQNGYNGLGAVLVMGEFTMSENAEITGNIVKIQEGAAPAECIGGGVYVYQTGTFTMSGGTISGNTADKGGGVYVVYLAGSGDTSSLTISNGATITGNTAKEGGGVYVETGATFTNNGDISGNTQDTGDDIVQK